MLNGSANWSNFAYSCDEQMQQLYGRGWTASYFSPSTRPGARRSRGGRPPRATASGARMTPDQPIFGQGIYRYMSEGG